MIAPMTPKDPPRDPKGPGTPADPNDPWAHFPGGNPFGPGGPFAGRGAGGDPLRNMDEWFRAMGIDARDFQHLFDDLQRNLQDAFRNLGQDPSKGFVSGFSVRMGPDGKPHISTFGNKAAVARGPGGAPAISADEREPLTDVIEDEKQVAITMEMPGVDKTDINLNMTEDALEISVDNERRKYHKRVRLPVKVDPATTKATYKNGILDVTVKRLSPGEAGVRIQVD
jgi:HSP20 family protein